MTKPDALNAIEDHIQSYVTKLCAEQEYLTARFLQETGLKPSEICIVDRETPTGRVFHPDLKSKYVDANPKPEPQVVEYKHKKDAYVEPHLTHDKPQSESDAEEVKDDHFKYLLELEELNGGGWTHSQIKKVCGMFHNEGFEKGQETARAKAEADHQRAIDYAVKYADRLEKELEEANQRIDKNREVHAEQVNRIFALAGERDHWAIRCGEAVLEAKELKAKLEGGQPIGKIKSLRDLPLEWVLKRLKSAVTDSVTAGHVTSPCEQYIKELEEAFTQIKSTPPAARVEGLVEPTNIVHRLKVWPEYFKAILEGKKRFEYRINDRNYGVGDVLHLFEFEPVGSKYSGREMKVQITYAVFGPAWGLPDDAAILSIIPFQSQDEVKS